MLQRYWAVVNGQYECLIAITEPDTVSAEKSVRRDWHLSDDARVELLPRTD